MFNDPGWASKEEWDAYAWLGFAFSEAQVIEMQLQVVATAPGMSASRSGSSENGWFTLYDEYGRLTFGSLLKEIRKHSDLGFPEELVQCSVRLGREEIASLTGSFVPKEN